MNNTLKTTLITHLNELIVLANELITEEKYRMQETARQWQEDMEPAPPLTEYTAESIFGNLRTDYAERHKRLFDLSNRVDITHWVGRFTEWQTRSENLILYIVGANSFQAENFRRIMNTVLENHKLVKGRGILKALKTDLERGLLGNIKNQMRKEISSDFLERAQYYLEMGDKDSAAFLGGAVLENGLRKIANRHNVPVKDSDDISSLNTKLANAEVYPRSAQKQIQAWKAVRDPADHGKFGEYTADTVKYMLDGVQHFIAEHFG